MYEFYKGKRVLVTGHTGFKGSWLCKILLELGAEVYGYALTPPTTPSLFEMSGMETQVHSEIGDVRDFVHMQRYFEEVRPQVVFHLAAQPLVRESYKNPVATYETNVMGTVHLLECARKSKSVESVLNVTTDKVYENKEWVWGYREDEPLDGYDPYSNSKSCSELVTHSYIKSFFGELQLPVSTARAGNVIGGGDFAVDRIVPDCIRAMEKKEPIIVRNPYSTRPYQHVLEPLYVYLLIAMKQAEQKEFAGYYNVGPEECDCVTTGELVTMFCDCYKDGATWKNISEANPVHEANFLKLDCSKLKNTFGWKPAFHVKEAIALTVEFSKKSKTKEMVNDCMERQIALLMERMK